jgi:hypothetical protein
MTGALLTHVQINMGRSIQPSNLARGTLLGETILNRGGTTFVPERVMKVLGLEPRPGERSKLLWTASGRKVTVAKGTPQSDWRKTMLRRNGTTAIPRHIRQALKLKTTSRDDERVQWVLMWGHVTVRRRRRA